MNRFNTLLLISAHFFALSCALPQGYGPTNTGGCQGNSCNQRVPSSRVPAGCRIDYRNIYDVEQVEYFDKECTEKYKNVCEDKFQRICKPYEEEVCSTKYEKKCEQLTKRQCYADYRDVPYQEEECNNNYVRECPQIWEQDGNAKVWVPDTSKCVGLVSNLLAWKLENVQEIDFVFYFSTKPLANLSTRARKRNIKGVRMNLTLNAMIIRIKIASMSLKKDAKIKRPKNVEMFLINIVKTFTDADLNKSPEGSLSWFATMAPTRPSPTKKWPISASKLRSLKKMLRTMINKGLILIRISKNLKTNSSLLPKSRNLILLSTLVDNYLLYCSNCYLLIFYNKLLWM